MKKILTAKAFSCAIDVEDGKIINAPSFLAQFKGQELDKVIETLNCKPYKLQRVSIEDCYDI